LRDSTDILLGRGGSLGMRHMVKRTLHASRQ
jgi:hypothetical protein